MNKDKENLKYYAAFSFLEINPILKSRIFEYFDFDIKRAWCAKNSEISELFEGLDYNIRTDFEKKTSQLDPNSCLKRAMDIKGIKIATYHDELYPKRLKEIPDFPLSFYYLGDLEDKDYNHILAMVGSRNATQSAKSSLNKIVSGFKNTDLTIVSGLAYGIDAASHQAALDNNLKTIGVIATGLDITYPIRNKKLYSDILNSHGAIISEYPKGVEPMPFRFPQRNRIVVGMSQGTLVAEARIKSGAMISARLTLDYNRELMCIPGNILNPNTEGIYKLIEEGAGIVTKASDVLNYMNWDIKEEQNKEDVLSKEHKQILDTLSEEKTFDEISNLTHLDTQSLMVNLTELELKGLIKQTGNRYFKNR